MSSSNRSRFFAEIVHAGLKAIAPVSDTAKNAARSLDLAKQRDLQEALDRFSLPKIPVGTTKEELFGLPPKSAQPAARTVSAPKPPKGP